MERVDRLANGLKIIQSDDVFSFSVDAVLLANFAHLTKYSHVVDLCSGNGAVGLMVSHKTQGPIELVEIQSRLAEMAERSVRLNQLEDRVEVINADLKEALSYIKADSVDAVLCNPPYFAVHDHSRVNPNDYLALARHELTTNLDEVLAMTSRLLKTKGHLFMVHRPDRLLDIIRSMEKYQVTPKRMQLIYPKKHKEANILLIEGIKQGKAEGFKVLEPFVVHNEDGSYTDEMQVLFNV